MKLSLFTNMQGLIVEWPNGMNDIGFHVAEIITDLVRDGEQANKMANEIVRRVNLFDEMLTFCEWLDAAWRDKAAQLPASMAVDLQELLAKTKSPAYNRALSDVARMDTRGDA